MKNAMKRIMSILLVALLLVSALPLAASAAGLPAGFVMADGQQTITSAPETPSVTPEQTQEQPQEQTQQQDLLFTNSEVSQTLQDGKDLNVVKINFKAEHADGTPVANTAYTLASPVTVNLKVGQTELTPADAMGFYPKKDEVDFKCWRLTGHAAGAYDRAYTDAIPGGAEIDMVVTYIRPVTASLKYGTNTTTPVQVRIPSSGANIATVFALTKAASDLSALGGLTLSYSMYITHGANGVLNVDHINPGETVTFELFNGTVNAGSAVVGGSGTLGGTTTIPGNGTTTIPGNGTTTNPGNGTTTGGSGTFVSNGDLYLGYNSANANKDPYPVMLYVYTKNAGNGITYSADFNISGMASDDKTSTSEIYNYLKNYYNATTSDGIRLDGIYEYTYNFNSAWAQDMGRYDEIFNLNSARKDGRVELAVVLSNAKLKTSSNADSSNPKTGDAIFAPIAVLGVSATALAAVMFFYNKKRMAQ